MNDIQLSPQYALNPSLRICVICHNDTGDIVCFGKISRKRAKELFGEEEAKYLGGSSEDTEAPYRIFSGRCGTCMRFMKEGIILICVDDNEKRTGDLVCVKEKFLDSISDDEARKKAIEHRVAFLDNRSWDKVGLPRGGAAPSNSNGVSA